ncbi:MAG: uroporphyrinogen decarboxylase family protein, partial [Enterobacter hormaechei]|nr:uroporphyrinogen decarboxylase family protein [Enterobacter hormaechei]
DLDPHASLSRAFGVPADPPPAGVLELFGAPPADLSSLCHASSIQGLDYVCAQSALATLERRSANQPGLGLALQNALARHQGQHDYILLDCAPTLGLLMINALAAADRLIIPTQAEPLALHALLDKLAKSVTLYLNAQIKAGAQSVMIFDTWGGVLTGRDYQQFSLYYMHKIVDGLLRENDGRRVPVTLFTKGGGQWLEAMAATGCDALGLDWTTDIADARRRVGDKVALQGNMDPSMLYAQPARIEEEVSTILSGFGQGEGHVFNLGHGIHQDVPPEHAGVFVEAVHRLSAQYHK